MLMRNNPKPSQGDWLAALPHLKKFGSELKGPCPGICGGGDNRFSVSADGTVYCRGCEPSAANPDAYRAIIAAAGFSVQPENEEFVDLGTKQENRWQYLGTQGSHFEVVRIDGPDGKKVWQEPTGVVLQPGEKWKIYSPRARLAHAPFLIVEGERTADIAAEHLPDTNVCTWQRSIVDTDWSVCQNRQVHIWPDNDKAGFDKASIIASQIKCIASEIQIVHAGGKWSDDAADFAERGESLAEIISRKSWPVDADALALKPIVTIRDDGLHRCLQFMNIRVRYNLRAMRADIWCVAKSAGIELPVKCWTPLTDRIADAISEQIRKRFVTIKRRRHERELVPAVFGRERWTTCLNAVLFRHEIDLFKEWLDQLTPEPSPRLDRWVADLFNLHRDSVPFVTWASRFLLLGAVQRTYNPGCKLDEMPVFVGKQGLGKSTIGLAILPHEFQEDGHGDALVLASTAKEFAEALLGKITVEASEMAGLGRADIERLKSNITRLNDGSVRLAYRRNPESMPRRCVFYGTSNERECLPNDVTGNRRFVVIEFEGDRAYQAVESFFDQHRLELWKAAKHAYLQGDRANLPRDMYRSQQTANEAYRRADELIENDVARLDLERFRNGVELSVLTEILYSGKADQKLNSRGWGHRIGKALRSRGWTKKRTRHYGQLKMMWFPP